MIASPRQALMIWCISWISLVNSYYARHLNMFDLSFCNFIQWMSCMTYWRNPQYNWVRVVDILVSVTNISYHMMKARSYPLYWMHCVIVMCLYPLGWLVYFGKKYWISFYMHALMHLLGNLANANLYSELYRLRNQYHRKHPIYQLRHFSLFYQDGNLIETTQVETTPNDVPTKLGSRAIKHQ